MTHPLRRMALHILEIVDHWTRYHPPGIFCEDIVRELLIEEGLNREEMDECIELLKANGYFYAPNLGTIALVK